MRRFYAFLDGLTLDGSQPGDEALLETYVVELQRLAGLQAEGLREARRRHRRN